MADISRVTQVCLERLAGRYTIMSLMLGGSAATHPDRALDADVCAVVREDVMDRARFSVAAIPVDLFICGVNRLETDFKKGGLHHHLVRLFATGKQLYGDKPTTDALQSQARIALRSPAPAPSKQSAFAHRSRPFNLLRKFRNVCKDDPATAGLIAAELVHSSVEAYFALNHIWTIGIRERMAVIAAHNPQASDVLQRVMESPLETLRRQPELLEAMVRLLVGDELGSQDIWLTPDA